MYAILFSRPTNYNELSSLAPVPNFSYRAPLLFVNCRIPSVYTGFIGLKYDRTRLCFHRVENHRVVLTARDSHFNTDIIYLQLEQPETKSCASTFNEACDRRVSVISDNRETERRLIIRCFVGEFVIPRDSSFPMKKCNEEN